MRRVEFQATVSMMAWLTEADTQDLVKQHILSNPQIQVLITDLGYKPRWQIWPLPHREIVNIQCSFDIQESELTWLLLRYPESTQHMEY